MPEPELALVVNAAGEIVAYTIGNDVSSRSIEGENPLYLPQAKTYRGSCALGPCLVPVGRGARPGRDGDPPRRSRATASRCSRARRRSRCSSASPAELVDWLFRAQDFPVGVVLLTGTSIVPAQEFTLLAGDEVRIAISGLGELVNTVEVVGSLVSRRRTARRRARTRARRRG